MEEQTPKDNNEWIVRWNEYFKKNWILLFIIFVLTIGFFAVLYTAQEYRNECNEHWHNQFIAAHCVGVPEYYNQDFNISQVLNTFNK